MKKKIKLIKKKIKKLKVGQLDELQLKEIIEKTIEKNTNENEIIIKEFRGFVGEKEYKIIIEQNSTTDILSFILEIITFTHFYVIENTFTDEEDSNYKILMQMCTKICNKNKQFFYKHYTILDSPKFTITEPFIFYNNIVIFNKRFIQKFMSDTNEINLTLDDSLRKQTLNLKIDYNQTVLIDTQNSNYYIKLLIIADHISTHFLDICNYNHTDYISHLNFGKNVFSLHTSIKFSELKNITNNNCNVLNYDSWDDISNLNNLNLTFTL